MKLVKDLDEVYCRCEADGIIGKKSYVDTDLIVSLQKTAEKGLEFIKKASKGIAPESTYWTFIFREYYEVLRAYIECYMLFDKRDSDKHQCKNAYICHNHPNLELDWEFLETARLKRNAINYKGQLLKYEDWKMFKIKFDLHISKISREVKNKLKEYES